jgi:hypothetical protein
VQEGRREEAEGRRLKRLYSKLFNLLELVGYFHRAVLAFILGLFSFPKIISFVVFTWVGITRYP